MHPYKIKIKTSQMHSSAGVWTHIKHQVSGKCDQNSQKVILHWSSLFLGVWGNNEVLTLECIMKSGGANYISLHILTIYNISVHSSHGQQNKQNEKTLSRAPEDNHEGRIAKEVWLRGFVMAIWRSKGLGDFMALNFMVLNFNMKELFLGGSLQSHHICTSTITWHNTQFSFA